MNQSGIIAEILMLIFFMKKITKSRLSGMDIQISTSKLIILMGGFWITFDACMI